MQRNPKLLTPREEEMKRLRADLRRARRALRFYARGSVSTVQQRALGLMTTYEADCGLNAREALRPARGRRKG